jgi:K+-sensing histidine kinase KdpD
MASASPVQPVYVDPLRDIFLPLQHSFDSLLTGRSLTLTLEVDKPGRLLWADGFLLLEACTLLLEYGTAHASEGSRMTVQVAEIGIFDEIVIRVEGTRLSDREIDVIFSPGDRPALSNSQAALHRAYLLIEKLGGKLWADRGSEHWITFTVKLPKRRGSC